MWSPFPVPGAHNPKLALNPGVLPIYYVPTIVSPRPQVAQRNQGNIQKNAPTLLLIPGLFP